MISLGRMITRYMVVALMYMKLRLSPTLSILRVKLPLML